MTPPSRSGGASRIRLGPRRRQVAAGPVGRGGAPAGRAAAARPARRAAGRSGGRPGGTTRAPQRGSRARPSRASRRSCRASRRAPTSTCTTPTACGCRSCSPRPASGRGGSARTSSPPAGSTVDGQVVTELGVRIDPTRRVHVDGVRVQLDESRVYLAFNKPLGVVTTMSDDLGPRRHRRLRRRPQGAAVPRRPARRRHRGPAAPHQRRRARPPAAAPALRRAQDLPRPDPRPGAARPRPAAARGRRARGRPGPGRLVPGRRLRSPARRWSRWSCTRAASTSCGGCSPRSGHPVHHPGAHAGRPDPPRRHQAGQVAQARRSAEVGALYAAAGM